MAGASLTGETRWPRCSLRWMHSILGHWHMVNCLMRSLRVSPSRFYKAAIHQDNGFAAVSHLRIKGTTLETKDTELTRKYPVTRSRHRSHSISPADTTPQIPRSVQFLSPSFVGLPLHLAREEVSEWPSLMSIVADRTTKFKEEVMQCFHAHRRGAAMDLFPSLKATPFGTSPPTRACNLRTHRNAIPCDGIQFFQ